MQLKTAAAGAALAVLMGNSLPAWSQSSPTTLLHLSATGAVPATPDELAGDLEAQATSTSTAEAQRRLNTQMAEALRIAQSVPGLDARASGYMVAPTDDKRTTWTARQVLELRSTDGDKLRQTMEQLQEKGLIATSLSWQLSVQRQREAHDKATLSALKLMRARAEVAAEALGLHVDHLQDVRLNDRLFQPRVAFAAAQGAPPQATRAPEEVAAEVSADVVLVPGTRQ